MVRDNSPHQLVKDKTVHPVYDNKDMRFIQLKANLGLGLTFIIQHILTETPIIGIFAYHWLFLLKSHFLKPFLSCLLVKFSPLAHHL